MKRILLILIVSLSCVGLKAQTKEETEKFIAKCANEAVGLKTYTADDKNRLEESLYKRNDFELTKIFTQTANKDYAKGTYTKVYTYTNLNWANVVSIELDTIPSLYYDDDVAIIRIGLSTKIQMIESCQSGTYNIGCENTYYWNGFTLIISRNRAVACKKAFAHLVKLCKEENKSPFDN
jgi:hypothetical protein